MEPFLTAGESEDYGNRIKDEANEASQFVYIPVKFIHVPIHKSGLIYWFNKQFVFYFPPLEIIILHSKLHTKYKVKHHS